MAGKLCIEPFINDAMHPERYELYAGNSINSFEFISVGKRGNIIKTVQFQQAASTSLDNLFPEKLTAAEESIKNSNLLEFIKQWEEAEEKKEKLDLLFSGYFIKPSL